MPFSGKVKQVKLHNVSLRIQSHTVNQKENPSNETQNTFVMNSLPTEFLY